MGYSPWGRKRTGHNLSTKQQQRTYFNCSCKAILLATSSLNFSLSDDLQVHSFCCRWQFNLFLWLSNIPLGFPGGSVIKNLPANRGDMSSILGSGRFPGEGNGNPLQYSCLENPMDGGAWCRLQGRARLSNLTFTLTSTIHF